MHPEIAAPVAPPAECVRRRQKAAKVVAFFRARDGQWIVAVALEQFGRQSWRTRVSEARQVFAAEGGVLENRVRYVQTADGFVPISEYRYRPQALGRSAEDTWTAVPVRLPLLDGPVGAYQDR